MNSLKEEKIILKNVLILTGSAHKQGTSFLLADKFEKGALKSGNKIKRYDTAFLNVGACKGCNYCRKNNGNCIQKDDFNLIKNDLMQFDIVVFITPIYYFGMSAQLKAFIDRFHCMSSDLGKKHREGAILITTQASSLDTTADALISHYKNIINYLEWENKGILIAKGVPTRKVLETTNYPQVAEKMGENIKKGCANLN